MTIIDCHMFSFTLTSVLQWHHWLDIIALGNNDIPGWPNGKGIKHLNFWLSSCLGKQACSCMQHIYYFVYTGISAHEPMLAIVMNANVMYIPAWIRPAHHDLLHYHESSSTMCYSLVRCRISVQQCTYTWCIIPRQNNASHNLEGSFLCTLMVSRIR